MARPQLIDEFIGKLEEWMEVSHGRVVLAALYLIYTEGHTATTGDSLTRVDLSREAIRIGRVLTELMPDEPEAVGLLALMLLTEARRPARTADDGSMVRLADQDRRLWDRLLITEGHTLVLACLRRNQPGPFQIQAAIAAVHADAATAPTTDWSQIVAVYDQLHAMRPNAVIELNRAVAVGEMHGAAAGLDALYALDVTLLEDYQPYHAARADLLAPRWEERRGRRRVRPRHRAQRQPNRAALPRTTAQGGRRPDVVARKNSTSALGPSNAFSPQGYTRRRFHMRCCVVNGSSP